MVRRITSGGSRSIQILFLSLSSDSKTPNTRYDETQLSRFLSFSSQANAYAALLRDLWSGELQAVDPALFKSAIGKVAPQFTGYSQQDSQELVIFLLDGLHEDVNKVRKEESKKG